MGNVVMDRSERFAPTCGVAVPGSRHASLEVESRR
jgi:hypothetical protein